MIENQPQSKEDKAADLFDKFIKDINDLYPGIDHRLEHLRPLIHIKIIKNGELNDDYYKFIKDI